MKMKTSGFLGVFAALALALAPHAVMADLIYWMVDGANYNGNSIEFTYATIKADGVPLYIYRGGVATDDDALYNNSGTDYGTGTQADYFGAFDDSVSSFLVELWNIDDDSSPVGWQTYRAAELAGAIWKEGASEGGSGATPFTVSNVIPEPSSGLMLLLGGMLLALRRRKA